MMKWHGAGTGIAFVIFLHTERFSRIDQMAKETILLLDKENNIQWTLKTILESEKYIVLPVDTIERALQNFREFEVSGFITEYQVDHNHTPEVIRQLKKDFPELYVMMLTHDNLDEREYKKIIGAGIDDLFLKPVSSEKILIHLKKGLKHRKILLERKRLQERLNQLKTNRDVEEIALGEGLSHRKSFTVR
jgi:DNA-binding NtrC family response regulator